MSTLRESLLHNRRFVTLVILLFLVGIVWVTLTLVQKSQELRSKAAADTAVLSFSPTTVNTTPGGTFTTSVILNTGGQAVLGADILVQFDQTKLTLQNIAKPAGVHANFKTYAPVTTTGAFDTAKVVTNANTNGIAEFGIMAFDYSTSAPTSAFNGVMSPVATLTFQAKTGTSGSTTISYKYDGASSTTDSNVVIGPIGGNPEDILAQPTSVVAITLGGTASPVPTATPGSSASPLATPRVSATPTATPVATPHASASPSTTPFPSSSTGGEVGPIIVQLKLQGINSQRGNRNIQLVFRKTLDSTLAFQGTVTMNANASGVYSNANSLSSPFTLQPGSYDLFVDGPNHIMKRYSVTVSSSATTINLTTQSSLLTGDAFDNDTIDIFDYSALVGHFGDKMPGAGSNADFDFDDDVDIFDYSFIVGNFGRTGDSYQ